MSHSICVLIFKADVEAFKAAYPELPFALSNDGKYIITPCEEYNIMYDALKYDIIVKHKLTDRVVRATTDYFGGVGEQSALITDFMTEADYYTHFDRPSLSYEDMVPLQHYSTRDINEALCLLGVWATPEMDEFDVIGLGRWRSNEDFY